MRKVGFFALALVFLIVAAAPLSRISAQKLRAARSNYAPGEIIVKLKAGAPQIESDDQDGRLRSIARLAVKDTIDFSEPQAEQLVGRTSNQRISRVISQRGLDRTFVIKLDPRSDIESALSELRARDDVEYAEPNYFVVPGTIPNDPKLVEQWSLHNQGYYGLPPCDSGYPFMPNADIKAYEAWDVTLGSPDVIVAVSDTGIDLTHPDLAHNIYTNPNEIPGNGIDDDQNGYIDDVHGFNVGNNNGDVSDIEGHGTQMAGIIAAEINNNIGISGVCQSKILPVRFFKRTGPSIGEFDATVADAARSLIYSIAAGASIINASWRTLLLDATPAESLTLEDAVKATNDAGVLLVTIAGNEGYDLDYSRIYPASYGLANEIVVAASDSNDEIWHPPFYPYRIDTGYGPNTVHLTAPGVSVLTTAAHGDCLNCTPETDSEKWYTCSSGTSVSAALVSGVAALVKSKYPGDSALLLKRRILEGVEVAENLRPYVITAGRLSAAGALAVDLKITPPVLTEVRLKGKKLTVVGSGMKEGLMVVVAGVIYPADPKSDDGTVFLARVPKSVFKSGGPVPIKLRNADGGESKVLSFTR